MPLHPILAWSTESTVWVVAAVIVIGGLAVFGFDDVRRASLYRIWAISSVCFAESIRRRVLWVIPLAVIGVLAVSLLQHSLDPQEAIRQTIKFCLFATSLIITLTALILAATNLPREIEKVAAQDVLEGVGIGGDIGQSLAGPCAIVERKRERLQMPHGRHS